MTDVARFASPLGPMMATVRDGRLRALRFTEGWSAARFAAAEVRPARDPAGIVSRLKRYFDGELDAIADVEVELDGTAFQRRVWNALRRIPTGETFSYAQLARAIGHPEAVRAVGAANGANPICIVIPCHRVIGADGRLTGYAGGLDRKRWLLAHEARAGSLFCIDDDGGMQLEGVEIAVADVEADAAAYRVLLGVAPLTGRDGRRRFQLSRGAVELAPGAGRHAIRFRTDPGDPPWPADDAFHGVCVRVADAAPPVDGDREADAVETIDHVVVRTPDADRAIRLWRDRCGLRLALDRVFPERGVRLVFFRSGGITLEFAAAHPAETTDGPDAFHGVSYRVPDLAVRRERLLQAGVDVSAIRPGMRPGTSVATVRSGTAGVATLLLQVHGPPA